MRWHSGLLVVIALAMACITIVLPALAGATIRPRWPLPIGATRSMIRVVRMLGSVSRRSRSCGYSGVSLPNSGRVRASSSDMAVDASPGARAALNFCRCAARLRLLAVARRLTAPVTASPLRRPGFLTMAERDVDVNGPGQVAAGPDERVVVEHVEDPGDRKEDVVVVDLGFGLGLAVPELAGRGACGRGCGCGCGGAGATVVVDAVIAAGPGALGVPWPAWRLLRPLLAAALAAVGAVGCWPRWRSACWRSPAGAAARLSRWLALPLLRSGCRSGCRSWCRSVCWRSSRCVRSASPVAAGGARSSVAFAVGLPGAAARPTVAPLRLARGPATRPPSSAAGRSVGRPASARPAGSRARGAAAPASARSGRSARHDGRRDRRHPGRGP